MNDLEANKLIDELWNLQCIEDGTLTSDEVNRYLEIVDLLHKHNIEIPFGIEV
jgi:small-conductance mechanosensitive channel